MTEDRIIDGVTGEVVVRESAPPARPNAPFQILDPLALGGVRQMVPHTDWIATISAGHKVAGSNGREIPQASKDGTIFIHDPENRAPNLKEALAAGENKRLTITFPYDDLSGFIQQHFTRRSATALEVYGDQFGLKEIVQRQVPVMNPDGTPRRDSQGQPVLETKTEHITHVAGTERYRELLRQCKNEVTILFALARWVNTPEGPRSEVTFPDGFAWYRLRFTSRHSLNSIVGKLSEVKDKITGGKIAGLPFTLSITYRDVPGPDGKTRRIPVWVLDFKPPKTLTLTSGNMRGVLGQAIAEGEKLKLLPRPREVGIADAAADDADLDLDAPESVEILTNQAPPARADYWKKQWFLAVRGTELDDDVARARFIQRFSENLHPNTFERWTPSLATFMAEATEAEASALIASATEVRTHGLRAAMLGRVAEPAPAPAEVPAESDPPPDPYEDAPPDDISPDGAPPPEEMDVADVIEGELVDAALPLGAAVAPEEPATGEPMPSPKDRSDYSRLCTLATALGIDLTPYETTPATTRAELLELGGKLKEVCKTAQQAMTGR